MTVMRILQTLLSPDELELIETIFYAEAPWDYQLIINPKRDPYHKGECAPILKVCIVYNPQSFLGALSTVLHELAHAITDKGHTQEWGKQYIRLLEKYDYPKEEISHHAFMFNALKEWASVSY